MTQTTDLTNPVTPAHRPATSQDFAPQKKIHPDTHSVASIDGMMGFFDSFPLGHGSPISPQAESSQADSAALASVVRNLNSGDY